MENNLQETLLTISGGGVFGSIVTWLLGRKKENSEINSNELDNTKKAIELWRETAERLEEKVNILIKEVDSLRDQVKVLQDENHKLRKYPTKSID